MLDIGAGAGLSGACAFIGVVPGVAAAPDGVGCVVLARPRERPDILFFLLLYLSSNSCLKKNS